MKWNHSEICAHVVKRNHYCMALNFYVVWYVLLSISICFTSVSAQQYMRIYFHDFFQRPEVFPQKLVILNKLYVKNYLSDLFWPILQARKSTNWNCFPYLCPKRKCNLWTSCHVNLYWQTSGLVEFTRGRKSWIGLPNETVLFRLKAITRSSPCPRVCLSL